MAQIITYEVSFESIGARETETETKIKSKTETTASTETIARINRHTTGHKKREIETKENKEEDRDRDDSTNKSIVTLQAISRGRLSRR